MGCEGGEENDSEVGRLVGLCVLKEVSEEMRSSHKLQSKRGAGKEDCEQESIMPFSKLYSLLCFLLDSSPDTHTHQLTHSNIVTFPEDSVDQFSVLILIET